MKSCDLLPPPKPAATIPRITDAQKWRDDTNTDNEITVRSLEELKAFLQSLAPDTVVRLELVPELDDTGETFTERQV